MAQNDIKDSEYNNTTSHKQCNTKKEMVQTRH